jgi:hypothetical protein
VYVDSLDSLHGALPSTPQWRSERPGMRVRTGFEVFVVHAEPAAEIFLHRGGHLRRLVPVPQLLHVDAHLRVDAQPALPMPYDPNPSELRRNGTRLAEARQKPQRS